MLEDRMRQAIGEEYRSVADAAGAALGEEPVNRGRILAKLRRELHRIELRDHFPPPERESAISAIDELASRTEVGA